jgi:hypothetical protein
VCIDYVQRRRWSAAARPVAARGRHDQQQLVRAASSPGRAAPNWRHAWERPGLLGILILLLIIIIILVVVIIDDHGQLC